MRLPHVIVVAALCAVGARAQYSGAPFDELLKSRRQSAGLPSVAAGLSVDGETYWTGAVGYADVENKTPATARSMYRVASISKTITAVAIMRLVEQKKIALDFNIRTYVPAYPVKKWDITVRQLLNHTSGFRTYRKGEFSNLRRFANTIETVYYLAGDELEHQPGSKYLYSTLSYNLLAAAVEHVSGEPFETYLVANVFEPAGMEATRLDRHEPIVPGRVRGYRKNKYRELENAEMVDISVKFAGGGVLSNVEDLLDFGEALLDGSLLSSASIKEMTRPTKLADGSTVDYGLGVALYRDEEGRFSYGHEGAGNGFRSALRIYPEQKAVVVWLCNMRGEGEEPFANEIAELYFDQAATTTTSKKSSAEYLYNVALESGVEEAIADYYALAADSLDSYRVNAEELRTTGAQLVELGRRADAIAIFSLATVEYPNYVEGYVGLGDAYLADGNRGHALRAYKRALALDPDHAYAKTRLNELE